MFKNYHTYVFTRNWNCQLADEMYYTSIFCYGRSGSGKTKNVARPILERAIVDGRSCILYADKPEEYAASEALAASEGYNILHVKVDVWDPEHENEKAIALCDQLLEKPTLLVAETDTFHLPRTPTLLDTTLIELARRDTPDTDIYPVTTVLDGLCGNMLLCEPEFNADLILYCITMDSQIASRAWRERIVADLAVDLEDYEVPFIAVERDEKERIAETLGKADLIMQQFFAHMETILCTGINGISPKEHKEFAGHCFLGEPTARIGGKYAIEEYPSSEKRRMARPFRDNRINLSGKYIEDTEYAQIAADRIHPDIWIVEVNGTLQLANIDYVPYPVTFPGLEYAEIWMQDNYLYGDFIDVRSREEEDGIVIYDTIVHPKEEDDNCPCIEEAVPIVFTITRISQKDVDFFRIKYLMAVLHRHERKDLVHSPRGKELMEKYHQDKDTRTAYFRTYLASGFNPTAEEFLSVFGETDTPLPEETGSEEIVSEDTPVPTYHWDPKEWIPKKEMGDTDTSATIPLPQEGVLFLGGHPNMTKKLRQLFPGWLFVTDDYLKNCRVLNHKIIFYWTGHSSHKLTQFVNARISDDTTFLYVTATNISLLIRQMEQLYSDFSQQSENG